MHTLIRQPILALLLVLASGLLPGCSGSSTDSIAKARDAVRAKDMAAAAIHYRNAIQANDKETSRRLEYADVLVQLSDFPGAEAQLRQGLELGADAAVVAPQVALWMLDRGDFAGVAREFQAKKLDSPEANSDLRALVALALLSTRRPAEANQQMAQSLSPRASAYLVLAQLAALKQDAVAERSALDNARAAASKEGQHPLTWWVWRGLARSSIAARQFTQAEADFKTALTALPSHFGVAGEYGELLLNLGKDEAARSVLADLKRRSPKYFRTALIESMLLAREQKPAAAYDTILRVLAAVPNLPAAELLAASLEIELKQASTAERRLQKLVRENRNNPEAVRLLARINAERGQLQQAEDLLKTSLEANPEQPNALLDMSSLLRRQGRDKEALSYLQHAQKLPATKTYGHAMAASIEARLGMTKEAVVDFDKAVETLSDDKVLAQLDQNAFQTLVSAALRLNKLSDIKLILDRAETSNPREPRVNYWRSLVLLEQKDAESANSQIAKALDKRADYYPALSLLEKLGEKGAPHKDYGTRLTSAIEASTGDRRIHADYIRWMQATGKTQEQVFQQAKKSIEAMPASIALRGQVVGLLASTADQQGAAELITQGLSSHANNPEMIELAALWFERQKQNDKALEQWTRLGQLAPERYDITSRRARLSMQINRIEAALTLYEQASQANPGDAALALEYARALAKTGKMTEALQRADRVAGLPGRQIEGLIIRSHLQLDASDWKGVEQTASRLASVGARVQATLILSEIRTRQNDPQGALKELEKGIRSSPESDALLANAAALANRTKQYDQSIAYLERLLKKSPGNPYLLNDLAWAQLQSNNPTLVAQALTNAQMAVEGLADNAVVLDTLSLAQERAGEKVKALTSLRRVLELKPEAPEIRERVKALEAQTR